MPNKNMEIIQVILILYPLDFLYWIIFLNVDLVQNIIKSPRVMSNDVGDDVTICTNKVSLVGSTYAAGGT